MHKVAWSRPSHGAKHKGASRDHTSPLYACLFKGEPMAHWLFKEEPGTYSFANLERDGSTTWSGVTNALAQKNLRAIEKGDTVFFYHT